MSLLTLNGFRRSRCAIDAEARLRGVHGECLAEVIDLSMSGLNLHRPREFEPMVGHAVEVELRCGRARDRRVGVRGRVVRREAGRIALRFERLSPLVERELQGVIDDLGTLKDDTFD
ncbi:hypothetical protein GCM10028862_00320 [Luteimonas pelagia]